MQACRVVYAMRVRVVCKLRLKGSTGELMSLGLVSFPEMTMFRNVVLVGPITSFGVVPSRGRMNSRHVNMFIMTGSRCVYVLSPLIDGLAVQSVKYVCNRSLGRVGQILPLYGVDVVAAAWLHIA